MQQLPKIPTTNLSKQVSFYSVLTFRTTETRVGELSSTPCNYHTLEHPYSGGTHRNTVSKGDALYSVLL